MEKNEKEATNEDYKAYSPPKKKKQENNTLCGGIDPYEPYISNTLSYQRFSCQGFLKKEPKEKKFWQRKPIKRYFVLDHKIQKLRIF